MYRHPVPFKSRATALSAAMYSVITCQCPLLPLCFQQFPTIEFCNFFVLITKQIARGVGVPRKCSTSSFTLSEHPTRMRVLGLRTRCIVPLRSKLGQAG